MSESKKTEKQKVENKKSWFARHKVLTAIGVLFIIATIGSAASNGNKNQTATTSGGSSQSTSASTEDQIAKLNQPAVDGKFEFVVSSIECGKSSVGTNPYAQKTAQGQSVYLM